MGLFSNLEMVSKLSGSDPVWTYLKCLNVLEVFHLIISFLFNPFVYFQIKIDLCASQSLEKEICMYINFCIDKSTLVIKHDRVVKNIVSI